MARSFNGISDKITTPLPTVAIVSLTIAGWFNATSLTGRSCGFSVGLEGGAVQNGYALLPRGDSSGGLNHTDGLLNNVAWVASSILMTTGTWHHLLLTGDASNHWAFYIDGTQNGSTTNTAATPTTNAFVGWSGDNGTPDFFNGSIADIAVWNAHLTQLEISALVAGIRPDSIRPASLLQWLPLDGLQSPEPDLSGNKNNGTLVGTSLGFGPPVSQSVYQ